MSILVTGANGFVGAALVRDLVSRGHHVAACTRINRDHYGHQSTSIRHVSVEEINGDTDWSRALNGVNIVIHAAARVHVLKDKLDDPLSEFRKINVAGTLNLAKQAEELGVKRLVYISSIKVNGESTVLGTPFTSSDTVAPVDPYGISKHEAELALMDLADKTNLQVSIIRPPLVYGPGVKANFAALINAVNKGVPLPFGLATTNRRSLVSINNLVDLIVNCIDNPNAANQTFLVSDDEDLSTAELLIRIGVALGKPARLIKIPLNFVQVCAAVVNRKDMAQRLLGNLQVDISKTKSILNWSPPVTISEGLHHAVKATLK